MLTKNDSFTVKSWYCWLVMRVDDAGLFPHKQIWKVKIPPSVSFFAWEACRECILTIDKLRK